MPCFTAAIEACGTLIEEEDLVGSALGKSGNCNIGRDVASQRLRGDLFCCGEDILPMFEKGVFKCSYPMPREFYESIRNDLMSFDLLFRQQQDETKRMGASADIKMTAELRMLSKGRSVFSLVEYLRISEPLAMKCMKRFLKVL